MIDQLNNMALKSNDLHEEVEFLIKDLIPKKMITMFYADGGMGKTWFSYAIAAYLCKHSFETVYYLDFDNPIVTLKERKIDELLIDKYPRLNYLQRSKVELTPLELIEGLSNKATAHAYNNMTFLIDSIRDVDDINDDKKAMRVMGLLKNIREAGGTVILVHHANKDGKNYQGSNNIKNSLDCMFKLTKLPSANSCLSVELETQKERGGVRDCAFSVDTENLELKALVLEDAKMSPEQKKFIEQIQAVLKKHPDGIKQGDLLAAIGSSSSDKTTKAKLDSFEDKYYKQEKQGNSKIYKKI